MVARLSGYGASAMDNAVCTAQGEALVGHEARHSSAWRGDASSTVNHDVTMLTQTDIEAGHTQARFKTWVKTWVLLPIKGGQRMALRAK